MTVLPVMVRAEAIAKEFEAFVPGVPDYGLRLVEGKPELGHHHPRPRQCLIRKSAAEDDEVVGIGDDMSSVGFTSSSAPPVLEEAVHVDVSQQRTDDAPYAKGNFSFERVICDWRTRVGVLDLRLKK
jgi:hypothetical protein